MLIETGFIYLETLLDFSKLVYFHEVSKRSIKVEKSEIYRMILKSL